MACRPYFVCIQCIHFHCVGRLMQILSVRPRFPFCTLNADQAVTMMSSFCMMSLSIVFQKKRLQHIPGTMSNLWTHGTFDCCENIGNCKGTIHQSIYLSIFIYQSSHLPIYQSTYMSISIYLSIYTYLQVCLVTTAGTAINL